MPTVAVVSLVMLGRVVVVRMNRSSRRQQVVVVVAMVEEWTKRAM
jgi:hypothetical protein